MLNEYLKFQKYVAKILKRYPVKEFIDIKAKSWIILPCEPDYVINSLYQIESLLKEKSINYKLKFSYSYEGNCKIYQGVYEINISFIDKRKKYNTYPTLNF